jgi:hypothetical protein
LSFNEIHGFVFQTIELFDIASVQMREQWCKMINEKIRIGENRVVITVFKISFNSNARTEKTRGDPH